MKSIDMCGSPGMTLDPELDRELLRAYIDSAIDGIFVVCDEMKFIVANRMLTRWFGIPENELIKHGQRLPLLDYLGIPASGELFRARFQEVLAGESVRFELEIAPDNTDNRWVEITLNQVDMEGVMVIGIMRDISERKSLIQTMSHFATHDDLTGLSNRREFHQQLEVLFNDASNNGSSHVLIYIDLDQFKVVNDTCGHQVGDRMMSEVAGYLEKAVPSGNVLARLGGDEFGVIVRNSSVDQAMLIAENIRELIGNYELTWKNRLFRVSASIGVCGIDSRSSSPESILSAADAACYVAKDNGRNRVQLYFGGVQCTRKQAEMEWVPRIEKALKEDRLQLHFQKIVSLHEPARRPCAYMEVLLRLIDEHGKLVPPGAFFPAAERYNLMPAIDRWVVEYMLIRSPEKWMALAEREGVVNAADIHCGINLSGASLNDDGFVSFLQDVLGRTTVPHSSICFEITETVAISNIQRVTEFMHSLKSKGCSFALDDFGKGMSSFGYLRNLPVDYLKIDGALVQGIIDDEVALTMVEAINRIAYAMDIETIAEFVENERVRERLRAIGVDYGQGFGIHCPEPL